MLSTLLLQLEEGYLVVSHVGCSRWRETRSHEDNAMLVGLGEESGALEMGSGDGEEEEAEFKATNFGRAWQWQTLLCYGAWPRCPSVCLQREDWEVTHSNMQECEI